MWFDLQLKEPRVREDVEPLQATVVGLVLKVKVSLPLLRALLALCGPPVDEDFVKRLFDFHHLAAPTTLLLQEKRMPAVYFSSDIAKDGGQSFAVRTQFGFLCEHMPSDPAALNRFREQNAGRIAHSPPKSLQFVDNRANLLFL
jgi:hypothetical protein